MTESDIAIIVRALREAYAEARRQEQGAHHTLMTHGVSLAVSQLAVALEHYGRVSEFDKQRFIYGCCG